jgi:hypothetical protein
MSTEFLEEEGVANCIAFGLLRGAIADLAVAFASVDQAAAPATIADIDHKLARHLAVFIDELREPSVDDAVRAWVATLLSETIVQAKQDMAEKAKPPEGKMS